MANCRNWRHKPTSIVVFFLLKLEVLTKNDVTKLGIGLYHFEQLLTAAVEVLQRDNILAIKWSDLYT